MEEISLRRKQITWGATGVVLLGVAWAAQGRQLDEIPRDAVNLDEVLRVAQQVAESGREATIQDLARAMNGQGVFKGEALGATVLPTGKMVFFVDQNGNGGWDRGYERDVFDLEVEHATNRLIANDKYGNHRYLVMSQKVADNWLTARMLREQQVHYGRYYVFSYYYSPHGYYGSYSWRRNVRVASVAHRGPGGHRFGK
jgi:hypothetical protein